MKLRNLKQGGILVSVFFLLVSLTACDEKEGSVEVPVSAPAFEETLLPVRHERPEGAPLFSLLESEVSGVDVSNPLREDHPLARLYYSGFACGGVVMADFNGDGFQDLFFTQGAEENQLFFQDGATLKFRNATEGSGVSGKNLWAAGAVAVDIEGDHDIDLLVCNYDAAPSLLINDGKGRFIDRAGECGLTQVDAFLMPTVCDYDQDGDLDIYLLANQYYREGGRPATPPFENGPDGTPRVKEEFSRYFKLKTVASGGYTMDTVGRPDLLLRNDGGKGGLPRFKDVTREAGIHQEGFGLSATWWDIDNDGWMDLHVGNDFSDPDRLFKNMGDGTFRDLAAAALPHSAWFSMGSDSADVNGDGFDDLFCADMAFTTHYKQKVGMGQMGVQQKLLKSIKPLQVMRNHLLVNTGMGPFQEAGQLAGIAKTDWTWGVKFADFDLDGRQDLFVTNGAIRSFNHSDYTLNTEDLIGQTFWDVWKETPPRPEENLAFQNVGDLKFEKRGDEWGLNDVGVSHGIACGDLDGDGDLDLVVTHIGKPVSIYRNESSEPLVRVDLKGTDRNTGGAGARLILRSGGEIQTATVRPSSGYLTTTASGITFGLGEHSVVGQLEVKWPDGRVQVVKNLKAGHRYTVTQIGTGSMPVSGSEPYFESPRLVSGVWHREADFDDFSLQPLLPHKLSQLGRATVWADVDGDGDADLFHGGASGFPGGLFRNEGGGRLTPIACPDLVASSVSEDAAAHFFDVDGDGDLDLYVASGSYEDEANSEALADRLYLNDGTGGFNRGGEIPPFRDVGSCAVSSDYDGDGDLDLFVGSRVIPGKYPLAATSRLLVNETQKGGAVRFVDGGGLFDDVGLVTDAVWADVDGDQLDDLVIVSEWGSVLNFRNEGGQLEIPDKLAGGRGWWTRIQQSDLDGDGDLDFVVGNFGLNTKYHASEGHPALIYYGDLTGDGVPYIIEAEFENETLFPIRGKSCSTAAMPSLAKKFQTFHAFAGSELDEIYPRDRLEQAQKFQCENLESGILWNGGGGEFTFQALPRAAQIAPVQGIVIKDLNLDGNQDLILSQNFYNPQFETGPYAGGVGVALLGNGARGFVPLESHQSGLLLRGDPRGLELVDLDGDGIEDLVCPLNNGPMVWQKGKEQPSK
ncbi:MAG: CRTAC1 family protein [Akkermansiaceae bacterium]|jgi:hypothetical protein